MKIENNSINSLSPQKTDNAALTENGQKQVENKKTGSSTDKALISNQAQLLSKALQMYKDIDDVRLEKLLEIQEQIDNGNYEIKPEDLAKNLMSRMGY